MKPLKAPEEGDFYPDWSYQELVDSMEVETVLNVDSGDYTGDSFYLVKDGDRFGLLTFGWGSCSGCDALAGCYTVEQATKLRDEIYGQIHWEDNAAALLGYVDTKDWELDWSWNDEAGQKFITDTKERLVRIAGGEA